ncbi:MAG: GNAT family N-acetyltransferase [Anaerolineae bacterium]|jgi:GNAT superfamily N-acetyltransferase
MSTTTRDRIEGELRIHPLTPERWADLEALFGERGACGGCWCMWWRLRASEFNRTKGEGTKAALRGLVEAGEVPGLLAYHGSQPVGWCSVGPRDAFPRLDRSRILARVDDQPVWSVVCFFVARPYRRRGVTSVLLAAAVDFARAHGATILEGYPVIPGKVPDAFAFTGLLPAFVRAGFQEVTRRSENRPIMRLYLNPESAEARTL